MQQHCYMLVEPVQRHCLVLDRRPLLVSYMLFTGFKM
jgi:hypothetical protein